MVRQERAIRTRQTILEAAADVFDELGYEAATISEVLKRAGVTKGALYFHFPSKEELAQGVLLEQVRALPVTPERGLVMQQLLDESLLLAHLLLRDSGNPIVRGAVRLTVDQGLPKDGLDRRAPMREWENHVLEVLRKAQEQGEITPRVDLVRLGKLLIGGFTGVQVLSNIMTDRSDLPERVADLYRYLMPSITAPGVAAQMDFDPGRGRQILEESTRPHHQRQTTAQAEPV
ncbi:MULTISPECIES: ScbR family autoregulator-binding transcription factor [unclassified Streptomyces]|uniref:ScbR family autoregulator-binding transcription factor n=1 Tax=unclassified Streptomyces TaxID=2593676 RepID=UPI0004C8929E|nr:ScbR family autoregulator-binding transcription factor [Streptomyces sp. NRRL F-5727]